ncbi:carboxypeptidase-like regulatory domain-containing protein [Hymenobacter sp. 5516J-16]|uniref:carboxypeptidase-like regulatory domain-containing protein n=1 Tax=Hymenobacter sp. 5516J-16 TaxID=2932253 RepID=UPI001FD43FF1|nr:carboxypeptidase-like regulatory domain-containing protein [Hymenobacter sp. 5516J-16]UOQ78295.1 carboxypeptidase-like regulatory domain-containing protein [Hymenobacter sp. 5516J-16]
MNSLFPSRIGLVAALSLTSLAAVAQNVSVSGRVTNAAGQGQPGVTVLERGTTNGTSTDADGRYRLEVAPTATLVFSAIGSTTQQLPSTVGPAWTCALRTMKRP